MKAEMATKARRSEDNAKAKRRKSTASLIQQAIAQLQVENAKVTILAVAKVAGITPALIHNTYPDLAEQIRGIGGKTSRAQRDAKHAALLTERETVLKGMASGKVVTLLRNPVKKS